MSFLQTILQRLDERGSRDLLIEVRGDRLHPVPARQTVEQITQMRTALLARGLQAGDRVALYAPNSARWVAADLATMTAGLVLVPLYARQNPVELARMVADAGAPLVIVADETMGETWSAHSEVPWVSYDTLLAEGIAMPAADAVEPDRDALMTLIYTSGTSGEPKGVMLSRANLDFMVPRTVSQLQLVRPGSGGNDVVFHFLPFCFAGSRIMLLTQLYRGNPLRISTDLNNLVQEMATADPNYYLNVPAVLERIRRGVNDQIGKKGGAVAAIYHRALAAADAVRDGRASVADKLALVIGRKVVFPKIKAKIGKSLDFLVCGSAPLSAETQRWFETLGIPVYQVYGLTETTAIVTMDREDTAAPGRVGVAIDGVEMKIADDGELVVRGPNNFVGYWNKPEATAEVLVGGWFHTGDQAELDAKGRLTIIGRVKNLLVPESGHNIAPEPIEERLIELCPTIEHAVIIGHARPHLTVIVTGATEADVKPAIERLNQELPFYKRLRNLHVASEPLTTDNGLLTANGKLRRRIIEKHFADAITKMYAQGVS